MTNKNEPIRIIDIHTGKELIRYNPHSYGPHSIAFSPDGLFLVMDESLTDLLILESPTCKEVMR